MSKLEEQGFIQYISSHEALTKGVKDYLLEHESDIDELINQDKFNFDDIEIFLTKKMANLSQTDLTQAEKKTLLLYLNTCLKASNQYFKYADFNTDNKSENVCGVRENWKCTLLALAAGITVGAIVAYFPVIGPFLAGLVDGGIPLLGVPIKGEGVVFFIAGAYTALSFYEWCCERIGTEYIQECEEPTGFSWAPLGCDSYRVAFFGPSRYDLTNWSNENATPEIATTDDPALFGVRVPIAGDESFFEAEILCIEDTREPFATAVTFNVDATETLVHTIPTPVWTAYPFNNTVNINSSFEFEVSWFNEVSGVTWTAPSGTVVTPTSGNTANMTFYVTGQTTIRASGYHHCSGDPVTLTKIINVQP